MFNAAENTLNLAQYAERAYLEYAMSVVKGAPCPPCKTGKNPCNGASCSP